MAHFYRKLAWLVILAGGCLGVDAAADPPKPRTLGIDTVLPIALDADKPEQKVQKVDLRLRLTAGDAPTMLEAIEVRQDKRATNFAPAFKFAPVQGTAPSLVVPLEITLTGVPFAGRYTAKVRASGGASNDSSELELSFDRPAAQLAALDEILLERNAFTGSIEPAKLYVSEQSHNAFARFASPLVSGQLRGPAGQLLAADLQLLADEPLGSGQRLALGLAGNGSFPLGTFTGSVRLDSPQLSQPAEFKFKLVNRVWIGFLPLTIVAAIALGIWYRKMLTDRQALDEALLEAQRAYATLGSIAAAQVEPELRQKIATETAKLDTAIRRAETPAALRAAAGQTGPAVDALLQGAEKTRGELRAKIAEMKTALGRPHGHSTEIAKAIAGARQEIDALLLDLERGFAGSLQPHLAKLEEELADALSQGIDALVTALRSDLDRVGNWPMTGIESEAGELAAAMKQAETVAEGTSAEAVKAAAAVARNARYFFTRTLRSHVAAVVREAVNALNLPAGDPALAEMGRLLDRLAAGDGLVDGPPPYPALAALILRLHDTLAEEIRDHGHGAKPVEEALKAGDLVAAARAAKTAAPIGVVPEAYGGDEAAPPSAGRLAAVDIAPPAEPAATAMLQVWGPSEAQVGQAVELRAVLEDADPAPAIAWTVVSGVVGGEERNGARFAFRPLTPDKVVVLCEVARPAPERLLSAQITISVVQTAAELSLVAIQDRMNRREIWMSVITGVFIAGAGTMLFIDTFVGSWRDFLFAALWGFTADVGAGQLRTLAAPLPRQLPAPAASR
jgi:hypothetical protein